MPREGKNPPSAGGHERSRPLGLGLFLVAAGLRLMPALSLLSGGAEAFVVTDDAPYHLNRIMRLLTDAPEPGDVDPLIAHPHGAVACWPWAFDALVALLSAPAAPDRHAVALWASFGIPWLGALAIPLLWAIGRMVGPRNAALAGAALLCVLPAHYDYSFFGRVDHHVLEPLFPLVGILGPLRGTPFATLLSGFALGAAFAFVPAALPVVAATLLAGGGLLLARRPRLAAGYGLACLAATVASLTASPHPWEWVFYSPSLLHVVLVAILAAGLATGPVSKRLGTRTDCARLAGGALGTACAALVALAVIPPFRQGLFEGMQYFHGRGFAALSLEAQPLWSDPARAGTLATWLAPLALLGTWRWLASGPPHRRAVASLTLFLLGPALFQRRFLVAASPLLALAIGEALWGVWLALARPGAWRRPVMRSALVVAAAAALIPSIRHLWALEPVSAMDRAMVRAARILALQAAGEPLGVLAPWSHGHVFQFERLATVCDNFYGPPENDEALQRCLTLLYERDEALAATRLREMRIAFIVLEPPHPDQVRTEARLLSLDPRTLVSETGMFLDGFAKTLWARLGLFAATARPGDKGPAGTTFLGRLREVRPDTGAVEAEVLLFSVDPSSPP